MGPHPQQADAEVEPSLDEVRARYPQWDVVAVFGGFQATPRGTVVIRAMWLSVLAERLSQLDS